MDKKDTRKLILIILAIGFVIVLLVYLFSLGKIDLSNKFKSGPSIDERKKIAEKKHRYLLEIIESKQAIKKKLDKTFKNVYFISRVIMVALYLILNLSFCLAFEITDIGTLMNYNQFFLVCILMFNFLTYGTIANLKSTLSYFKRKLEIWVYDKNINIEDEIKAHQTEADELLVFIKAN